MCNARVFSVLCVAISALSSSLAHASTPAPKCDADPSQDGLLVQVQSRIDYVKSMADMQKRLADDLDGPMRQALATSWGLTVLPFIAGGAAVGGLIGGEVAAGGGMSTTTFGGLVGSQVAFYGAIGIYSSQRDHWSFLNQVKLNAIIKGYDDRHRAADQYFDDGQENTPPSFIREYLTFGWSATNHLTRMEERALAHSALYKEEGEVLKVGKTALLTTCHIFSDSERAAAAAQVHGAMGRR
jgi:hypothetical protein